MQKMTSLKIQKLDPIEHILKRPDTYVGSVRCKVADEFIAINDPLKIIKKSIEFPPALLRIFVEALSNAIDNAERSRQAGVTASKIKVTINKETGETSVWNDGLVIPIATDEQYDTEYKHSLVFGELRTSTNFNDDEERTVSGRNGLGIKLTNVFSTSFEVDASDPLKAMQLHQKWTNNMKNTKGPSTKHYGLKTGFTEVTWIPDFKVFGLTGYTDDIISLYMRYVCDAAMLTKLNVFWNDEKLPIKTLLDYSKLYTEDGLISSKRTTPVKRKASDEEEDEDKPRKIEHVFIKGKDSEVLLTCCEKNEFEAISFVNGVFTMHGGKHVDGWSEALFRPLVEHFNKPKRPQVNIKDVKQFYRLFVVSTLVNPEFSSQSKTELTSPDVQTSVDTKTIKSILKWECTAQINDIIHSKEMLVMKKSESKKKGFRFIGGYDPANEAGGKNSKLCTLALCEGLSAKTFAVKGMDSPLFGRSGRDWFGVYALRGKILNVRKSNPKSISENKVITDIIQICNLHYGVDYTVEENFNQLTYGKLMILVDADPDGKHIGGLLINLIHYLFPSLLLRKDPFLVEMMTPLAKFTINKKESKIFYDLYEADAFYKANLDKHIDVKYFKGLGTHDDDEIAEEFGKRVVSFVKDDEADQVIVKVFGAKAADERKTWIDNFNPENRTVIDETTLYKTISTFINEDFITFSVDDCRRSIPNLMDGLKQSQRKILYACFLRNLKEDLKVAQLAGFVAEKTNYHHGEENLFDTIIKMANEFVGSNNVPLLFRKGQFGSRLQNGEDAANARYIFTRLEKITRLIFKVDDDDLMEKIVDDGDIVEPKFYVPIIPMILVNGAEGIGTGWSSSIPSFNPIDIVNRVKLWIATGSSKSDKVLIPWYRGFHGSIESLEKGRFSCKGICERSEKNKNSAIITEVPVGMSLQSVFDKLQELKEKKSIKDLRNYSTANSARFIIEETQDTMRCNVENLKLSSILNINNMVMFDENFKIRKYDTPEDIIDNFCAVRLVYYEQRKAKMILELNNKIKILKNKLRFISEVMDEVINIKRKKTDEVERILLENNYDEETTEKGYGYLLRMQVSSFTEEKISELFSTIAKLEKELETVAATSEKDMWLADLDEFIFEYDKWFTEMAKSDEKRVSKRTVDADVVVKPKRGKKGF